MADGPNIGYAAISVIPSLKGFEAAVSKGASDAGTKSGGVFSGAFSKVVGSEGGKLGPLLAAGITAGVGAAAAGLFKLGDSFDEQFDKIRTQTGATGKALEGLQGSFKNVLKSTATDFAGAGDAVAALNQKLGLTGAPLEQLSKQFIDLSRVTKTDLSSNVTSVTGLFNQFKVAAGDQKDTLDLLFRASQVSGVGVSDLASQITQSSQVFKALGFSVGNAATVVAGLGKAGLSASDVMPALSKVLAKGAKDGKNAQDVYRGLLRSIKDAPNDTKAAEIAFEALGAKAGPKFAQLIRSGQFSFDKLGETIFDGGDTISKVAKDTADFSEKFQIFKNQAAVALEPLATGVFDALTKGMQVAGPILVKVTNTLVSLGHWARDNKPIVIGFGAGVAAVLAPAFAAWAVSAGAAALATIAAAAPVIGLVAGVGLLGVAIVELVTHFDQVIGFLTEHWRGITQIILGPIGLAITWIADHFGGITDTVKSVVSAVASAGAGMWNWVSSGLSGILDGVVGLFEGAVNLVIKVINAAIHAYNLLPFHKDIDTIDPVHLTGGKKGPTVSASVTNRHSFVPGHASGGLISGPGGVDTIPGWLSHGEFVMNAISTKKFRPVLEWMNAQRFASGGLVTYHGRQYDPIDEAYKLPKFIRLGEVSDADFERLYQAGWRGDPTDHMEALYRPGVVHAAPIILPTPSEAATAAVLTDHGPTHTDGCDCGDTIYINVTAAPGEDQLTRGIRALQFHRVRKTELATRS